MSMISYRGKPLTLLPIRAFIASTLASLAAGHALAAESAEQPGRADQNSSVALEEIVVTSTRREETVKDTALSVDALSGGQLRTFGVQSLQDLTKVAPSVAVQNEGPTQQRLVIRGISSAVGATSGLYLDESPLEGGFSFNVHGDGTPGLRMHDVQRVEVLKGPQGTLFGSGSMAGTVRVIANKPNVEAVSAFVEAGGGSVGSGGSALFDGSATVNVPVIKDHLAIRAVGWIEHGGGFIDQMLNGRTFDNVDDIRLKGGRFMALWKVTNQLNVLASVNYQQTDTDGPTWWTDETSPYNNLEPSKNPYHDSYLLYNVTGEYDTGVGTVTAIYTNGKKDVLQPEDSTPTNCALGHLCPPAFPPLSYVLLHNFNDWTGELRFTSKFAGPLQLVAGAYYQRNSSSDSGSAVIDDASGAAACLSAADCDARGLRNPGSNFTPVGIRNYLEFGNITLQTVKQRAFYAQSDLQLFEGLTVTGGIRYFTANLSTDSFSTQDLAPGPLTPCNWVRGCITPLRPTFSGTSRESKSTYNAALLYKFSPQVTGFIRAASGFRIGGINTAYSSARAFGDTSVPRAYDPDSLWDYEIGTKAYLFDRRLYADIAYYHIDWSGQQVAAQSSGAFAYTMNAGKTKADGVELSSRFKATERLTLSAGVTYVKAVLVNPLPASVTAAGAGGNPGDRVPLVPLFSGSVGADYRFPLFGSAIGYAAANVNYRGGSATGFNSKNNYYKTLPPYALVDLRLGTGWDRYDASVYVENVTNRVAEAGVFANGDGARIFSPRPRTIGVRLSAQF